MIDDYKQCNVKQILLCILLSSLFLLCSYKYYMDKGFILTLKQKSVKDTDYHIFYISNRNDYFTDEYSIKKHILKDDDNVKIVILTTKKKVKEILKMKFDFVKTTSIVEIVDVKVNNIPVSLSNFETEGGDLHIKCKKFFNYQMLSLLFCFYYSISFFIIKIAYGLIEQGENTIDVIFIMFFTILLFIPILRISSEDISGRENRVLAKYQPLFKEHKLNENYGEQFDNWFSDRFNNRKLFVDLYRSMLKKLIAFDSNVLIGKNGWLFYLGDNGQNNYANTADLSQESLKNGLIYLKSLDDWCRKNNKKFYYIIAPDKSKIYGEYYKHTIKQRTDEYGIGNQFISYIQHNSKINALYLYSVLLKNKTDDLLYYKHDTHWNDWGACQGYKALLKLMKIPIGKYNFIDKQNRSQDLDNMLSVKIKEDKTNYKTLVYDEKHCERNKVEQFTKIQCKNNKHKEKILLIGDSFSFGALHKFFENDFREITMVHYNEISLTKEWLNFKRDKFDIIILLNVERYIPQILIKQSISED